jgi:hypothetical protein
MEPLSSIPVTVYSLLAGATSEVTAHAYIITPGTNEYMLHLRDQNVSHALSVYNGISEDGDVHNGTVSSVGISHDEQFANNGTGVCSFALNSHDPQTSNSGEVEPALNDAIDGQNAAAAVTIHRNQKV